MPIKPAPLALLVGDTLDRLSAALTAAGVELRHARGWEEAGNAGDPVVLVTASHVPVRDAELDRLPALRVVARAAAGFDNVDVEAIERRGLRFVHAPEANAQSAAELTMGLLFATARSIPFHDASLAGGTWSRGERQGLELAGRRLGIVGLGRVGSRVARMAAAIPMPVTAYDPFLEDARFEQLSVRRAGTFELLLAEADVLTLHCPLTPLTRGMLGPEQLDLLPAGAVVLNVARGGILDEFALARLLESGRLAAAGLDCWAKEPPEPGNPLLALSRRGVVATPHVGARTRAARTRVSDETAANILAALRTLGLL